MIQVKLQTKETSSPSRHVLSASQFTPDQLQALFTLTKKIADFWVQCQLNPNLDRQLFLQEHGLRGKKLFIVFYEPSTRTRASFAAAWDFLGGTIPFYTENAGKFSSAVKGETLEDTIRILASYGPDAIVLRHPEKGAAIRAATAVANYPVSILNGGDGDGEHPTQALLDIYTIQNLCGGITGKSIAFMGDIAHSRTIRSLVLLLINYQKVKLYFCAPRQTQLPPDLRKTLEDAKVPFYVVGKNWRHLIQERRIHVLYQTRLQAERFKNPLVLILVKWLKRRFSITAEIGALMREKNVLLMHPLPRLDEIHPACDQFSTSVYFAQAQNGLFVRAALCTMLFGKCNFS